MVTEKQRLAEQKNIIRSNFSLYIRDLEWPGELASIVITSIVG